MKHWERVPFATRCGGCGSLVKQGDPMLSIAVANLQRRLRRCKECAGEPVNWEQIAAGPPQQPREPPTFRPVAEMAARFDPKMRQAGERDE